MKTYVPNYYPRFSCRAGACRHSCCIGWEIDIDDDALEVYQGTEGDFGCRLRENIGEEDGVHHFCLLPDERCPFLTPENLCDIYIHLGEENLCRICADHPRYRNYLADRCEMGRGLCCEAAAELILGQREKTEWIPWEESSDEWEDSDAAEWEKEIFTRREAILALIQNRDRSIEVRVNDLLEQWLDGAGIRFGRTYAEWRAFYGNLEQLDAEGWRGLLDSLGEENTAPVAVWELPFEQLLVYFVNRHLPDSSDDWDFRARLAFALLSYEVIRGMFGAAEQRFDVLCDIARQYSAEIEYSENNISALLDELDGIIN